MKDGAGHVIRKTDEDLLTVSDDGQGRGKTIVYMTGTEEKTADVFQIGISWRSLGKLRERMKRQTFDWEMADKSLAVNSRNGIIQLRFVALATGLSVSIVLSGQEVEALKKALFEGLESNLN